VEAVEKGMSFAQASKTFSVPKTTIFQRHHGMKSQKLRSQDDQKLPKVLEERLIFWIWQRCNARQPPSHLEVRKMASAYIGRKDGNLLGKTWLKKFLERNPEARPMRTVAVDNNRLVLPERIINFFDELDDPSIQDIAVENRWNMDETGLMEGGDVRNGIAIGPSYRKQALVAKSSNKTWCTAVECMNAVNKCLPPLVIFKGANVQRQWIPTDWNPFEGWGFATSQNGWINSDLAVKWLEEIFLPLTKPDPPRPRLLVMDGHSTHMSHKFWSLCGSNDVHIVVLPSHSSHVTQPLDVGVFASLKLNYRKQVQKCKVKDQRSAAGKRSMLQAYSIARETAFLPCNIASGWDKTGLWPVNRAKPLSSEFVGQEEEEMPQATEERTQAILDVEAGPLDILAELTVAPPGETPTAARAHGRRIRNMFAQLMAQNAELSERVEELEAQNAALVPQRRRRVKPGTPGGLVMTADLLRLDAEERAQAEMQGEEA